MAGAVNRGAIDIHPSLDVVEDSYLLIVDRAIATDGHREQQVTILADNVYKHRYDMLCALVAIVVIYTLLVMPVT